MRVLFSSTGGDGHLLPLLPLAVALSARGDDVAVAAPSNQHERVDGAGLRHVALGPTMAELEPQIAVQRKEVAELPFFERRVVGFAGRFAEIEAPRRLEPLRGLIGAWAPELVIYEPADLAAPIAALAAGRPIVQHSFGRAIPEPVLQRAGDRVASLWRSVGLEPDPFAGAYRGAYIDICPPSLQTRSANRRTTTLMVKPFDVSGRSAGSRERPIVYVTLGTVFNDPQTFRLLLDALAPLACDVVMTIGQNRSVLELGHIPANATVAPYIPQLEILRECDVVVAHGGSGSFLAALAHGLPLVLLPRGADQFDNARACVQLGAAEMILPPDLTVDGVRQVVVDMLADESYAVAAWSIAAEIAAMPSAAATADELARTGV